MLNRSITTYTSGCHIGQFRYWSISIISELYWTGLLQSTTVGENREIDGGRIKAGNLFMIDIMDDLA